MRQFLHILGLALVALLGSVAPSAHAEDIYIAQTPSGADDGTTAANAHSVAFFNTAANWSSPAKIPGKIGPGDVVHLVGTITSPLTIHASGTSDISRITVLFGPSAVMTNPAWPNSGAIHIYQKDYITIDGGINGLIEDTDNGTNLGNHVDSYGVRANACNYLTVKNLTVANLYVRTAGSELFGYGRCISNQADPAPYTHFVVTHCTVHDAYIGIDSDYSPGCSDYDFSYNTAYNCNWGGRTGDRSASATLTGLSVHHNQFYNFANWDETSTNAFHHNGFYGWAESGGSLTDVKCYDNVLGPNYGVHSTSGIFFGGNISNVFVYNNIFLEAPADNPSNGLVTITAEKQTSGGASYILNNTFAGGGTGIAILAGMGTANYVIQNNIIQNVTTAMFIRDATNCIITADHNWAYMLKPGQQYSYSLTGTGAFLSLLQWQAHGYDVGMSNTNPMLDSTYYPQAGSPIIDRGADLSAFFTVDASGVSRPQGYGWDIGALEATTVPQLAPFAVRARIQTSRH